MTEATPPLVAAPPSDPGPRPLAFADRPAAFARLALRGAALELVTFGFYRFWLNTNIRRHLWAHTAIAGDGLEYTGRARELLIGFLMALAILAPVYFGYFLLGVEAERAKAFGSTPLLLVLFLFGQFAVYRARRYRLTRTTWRGVRFWMAGSGLDYMWRACLWSLLVWMSLGFAHPWRVAAIERYKMSRTFYGDLQGEFTGKAGDFIDRGWWIWIVIGPLFIATEGAIFYAFKSLAADAKALPAASGLVLARLLLNGAGAILIPLVMILLLISLYARFRTIEWRWWVEGLRLGPMSFASSLEQRRYFWLLTKFMLALLPFVLVAIGLVAYGVSHDPNLQKMLVLMKAKQQVAASQAMMQASSAGLMILSGYVLFILGLNILQRIFLQHHFWRMIVSSLSIRRVDAADHVAQVGAACNALGEGLADGLDVAGF